MSRPRPGPRPPDTLSAFPEYEQHDAVGLAALIRTRQITAGEVIEPRSRAPAYTATLVERHEAAGLVVLGMTNTPEFGITPVTEPDLHGPAPTRGT